MDLVYYLAAGVWLEDDWACRAYFLFMFETFIYYFYVASLIFFLFRWSLGAEVWLYGLRKFGGFINGGGGGMNIDGLKNGGTGLLMLGFMLAFLSYFSFVTLELSSPIGGIWGFRTMGIKGLKGPICGIPNIL